MRWVFFIAMYCCWGQGYGQLANKPISWTGLLQPSHTHLQQLTTLQKSSVAVVDSVMERTILEANQDFSFDELTTIVTICINDYANIPAIGMALTDWLRESHPIYQDKLPSAVNQFRGFVLASLGKFAPNEQLYRYVKAELQFSSHAYNIAAAASTAKSFPDKAAELIPLLEPFLNSDFHDQWVDITTPELNYPLHQPTKARHQILYALSSYGMKAYRSVKLLDAIIACNDCGAYGNDSLLYAKAVRTAAYIRKVTPACCQIDEVDNQLTNSIQLIAKANRTAIALPSIALTDQEGKAVSFASLQKKPFVLSFFYTQCVNPLKCVATVNRLAKLDALFTQQQSGNRAGIYGITYDPAFDTPEILKKYGDLYGVSFSKHFKFLKTNTVAMNTALQQRLQLRVNYGAGTVNQHGIQLFIFDKKGRIAAVCDNDKWEVKEVYEILKQLMQE